MLAQRILADTSPTVALRWVWIIVVVGAALTVVRLYMLRAASSRKIHPDRRNDQDNHRGMEQGGVYTYTPGMFSHSYPPSKETQPEEFRRDNPQPGREPRKPWPEEIFYEQTVYKEEFEELKKTSNPESR